MKRAISGGLLLTGWQVTTAAAEIPDAELTLVEEGHHLLSLCPGYGRVAERQLDLAHR